MNITALNMSLTTQITDEQKFCTLAPPSSHSLDVIVFDIVGSSHSHSSLPTFLLANSCCWHSL